MLVLLVVWVLPVMAGDDFPASAHLQAQLALAEKQFPDDLRQQRCWAASQAIWHYARDTFGPELAESWLAPWGSDGQWRKLCDGQGLRAAGTRHWGITCPYRSCPEGSGPYISLNHDRIYSGSGPIGRLHARYYYVLAHEMAHAIGHFYRDPAWADDHWADAVARAFGASVCPHSPYCGRRPAYPKFEARSSTGSMIVPPGRHSRVTATLGLTDNVAAESLDSPSQ